MFLNRLAILHTKAIKLPIFLAEKAVVTQRKADFR
jgi:hypothetical protein